jgi:hypothetical protein
VSRRTGDSETQRIPVDRRGELGTKMGSSSRAVPSGSTSTSQGRRSRSQSRSRSRAGSEVDPTESNGYYGGSNGVNNNGSGDPTMDFCNNFWTHGTPDDGSSGQEGAYDALMSRMKSSGKMMDEFRSFFKERCVCLSSYSLPCNTRAHANAATLSACLIYVHTELQ